MNTRRQRGSSSTAEDDWAVLWSSVEEDEASEAEDEDEDNMVTAVI